MTWETEIGRVVIETSPGKASLEWWFMSAIPAVVEA
jgi:hypothetical protein